MRYKVKVLKRFPDAHTVVATKWFDGTPRRIVVQVNRPDGGHRVIDPFDHPTQGHTGAWRAAYCWCVRNPESGKCGTNGGA